jgi:hypothetical protein
MSAAGVFVVSCSIAMMFLMSASTSRAQSQEGRFDQDARQGATRLSWVEQAVDRQVSRLKFASAVRFSASKALQQGSQKRSWVVRHPALSGALIGFGSGFLIGYLAGDEGVFPDTDKEFNAAVLGGVGALAGAIMGEVTTK